MRDDRSKRVIFVSYRVLNENTRYLGGAFRKGCVDEVVDCPQATEVGIVQMPCPEREYWGGALRKKIFRAYSSKETGGETSGLRIA